MGRGNYCRPNKKATTADYLSITVTDMKRHKRLALGWHSWQWSRCGQRIASVSIAVSEEIVTFYYSTKDSNGTPLEVESPVELTRTACNYGGWRIWFLCGCGRRVGRLFIHRQHVACRHCFNITYPACNEDEWSRNLRRQDQLYERLGGDRLQGLPPRRKGMHWRTYEKLSAEAYRQSMKGWMLLNSMVDRLKH